MHIPWKTPTANEDSAGTIEGKMQVMLAHEARRFREGLPAGGTGSPSGARTALSDSCPASWATPKASPQDMRTRRTTPTVADGKHGEHLSAQAHELTGTQDPKTKLTLNPAFVAWLMGWPRDSAVLTLPWGKRT